MEKKKTIDWKEIFSFIFCIALAVLIACLFRHYVGQRILVDGSSMENTLHTGDNLITDKISYRFQDPERFDIIVFQYAQDVYYIKRVIGLPGEKVQIAENGSIYINGSILEESYGKETMINPGTALEEITLGEKEYFVLGDNRNNSKDSRDPSVGVIHKKDIIGKAWCRVYPFDSIQLIKHK
ncbi:MAG: signal peptidase I [Lachnospiraceae bacterium]